MRHVIIVLAAAVICAGFLYCKKSPDPCWDTCKYPRKCFTYDCSCSSSGQWFYERANMCMGQGGTEYIALLPEADFMDTFGLVVRNGSFRFREQRTQEGSSGSNAIKYYQLPDRDSFYIPYLGYPGTGPIRDGWPTLNDKKFMFQLKGVILHASTDTIYATLRWFGLGSGDDLQEPLDFKMHIPKQE